MSVRLSACLYLIQIRCHSLFCKSLVALMYVLIIAAIFSMLALCFSMRFLQKSVRVNDFITEFVANIAHFDFRNSNVKVSTLLRSLTSLSLSFIALHDFLM